MTAASPIETLNTQAYSWKASAEISALNQIESERLNGANLPLYTFGEATGLSMSRYIAALCIHRASELESQSIALMETLSSHTDALGVLAEVEAEAVAAVRIGSTYYVKDFDVTIDGKTQSWVDYLREDLGCDFTVMAYDSLPLPEYYDEGLVEGQRYVYLSEEQYAALIQTVESKMDALNSLSQDTMIDLQALLDKRDQCYTLLTNALGLCSDTALAIVKHL